VFANLKYNHGFKRFIFRGKEKVSIEAGLLPIAQNLRKGQLKKLFLLPFENPEH